MVSVGRSVRSYVRADLLSTRDGSPSKRGAFSPPSWIRHCELEGFLLTQTYDHVIIAGDFNVDFAKVSPNRSILECFMQAFDLVRGDISSDISFTYRHDDHYSFCWVDHVICYLLFATL